MKNHRVALIVIVVIVLCLVFAYPSWANWQEQDKLLPSDSAAGDWFGCSADISDSIALIGAPYHNGCASDSGAVYLFDVSTGEQLAKLTPSPSDCAPYDHFGRSVALSGNTAVIGAWGKDSATGAVYLFDVTDPNTPIQTRTLTADDNVPDAYFGWSVAFEGNTAIIGARSDDEAGHNAGAAYLFDLAAGSQLFKLRASDAASSALFGQAVAISENTAIVGAHDGNNYRGSAYLFDVSTGSELSQLNLANDAEVGDMFGVSVAISGDIAVVGAYGDDAGRGSAHVYDVSDPCNPVKLYSLTIPNSLPQDEFGNLVAVSGNTLLVGAYQKSDPILGAYHGAVYLFDLATGDQLAKLVPSDVAPDDRFGLGAALDGHTAIVGSIWDDDRGTNSGSAYVFAFRPPIEEILDFIDKSVDNGTLIPVKDGKPGQGQLGALINMIQAAGNLIDAELLTETCWQLQDALEKTDGLSPPESAPDFVTGPAAPELAGMIEALMENLGCE